jgi:hypothetical protein
VDGEQFGEGVASEEAPGSDGSDGLIVTTRPWEGAKWRVKVAGGILAKEQHLNGRQAKVAGTWQRHRGGDGATEQGRFEHGAGGDDGI